MFDIYPNIKRDALVCNDFVGVWPSSSRFTAEHFIVRSAGSSVHIAPWHFMLCKIN